ncbi:MAG: valine--tRNA ligase [Deltaproteobacteria bacterium]|nr:MAG: valine--tRNA ligase [Deltaproteobacteria bacterium]
MSTELDAGYDPTRVEQRGSDRWERADAFRANASSDRPAWTIVLPPPNVTGALHMGHALGNTLQDILIRHRRMSGYEALWLPGTDHAGIATQMVVERSLREEGLDRPTLGRDAFVDRVWEWKDQYGDRIVSQMKRMGSSLDWSRERFTLDEGLSRAVREIFVRLWEDGLIHRDDRLVNWDPVGQTVLSDLEVEQEEEDGHLWHIAYPVVDSDDRIVVATTRPETLLGDTAVAVHPDDPRYTHLHGKSVALPLTDRTIPIITDPEAADMAFGSGAVKITPAHDFNDFETGRRNTLPSITILDLDGCLNDEVPERYRGLDREVARDRVVEDLEAQGFLVRIEAHRLARGRSQRTGAIVEPMSIGKQWFVRAQPLAEPAIAAVRDGRIRIVPEQWESTYFHWMENIRDWCISRQLWWGHRIPAWNCESCGEVTVARQDPDRCAHCGSDAIHQEEDVLDTWFSSALWPFSTLGWPEDTEDLRRFYPTEVLETGFDILFFWVARMIMMGLYAMDDVPFRTVFLHAMVRDRHGQKMSKSVGNVIDPLHLIDGVHPDRLDPRERDTYQQLLRDFPDGIEAQGADALRLTLAIYAAAGRDIKLDVRRVEGYRAFLNKLWNAVRFANMHVGEMTGPAPAPSGEPGLSSNDKWILTRLADTCAVVERALGDFRFNEAAQALYDFAWHEFCDWYVELAKPVLHDEDSPEARRAAQLTLRHVLDSLLKLLHPFTPFITEELWGALHLAERPDELLCHARFPESSSMSRWPEESARVTLMTEVVTAIRRIRSESQIPPGRSLPRVLLLTANPEAALAVREGERFIKRLTRAELIETGPPETSRPDDAATSVVSGVEIVIPFEGLVDPGAERERIRKELDRAIEDIAFFERKLGNPRFVERAPADVVARDRARLEAARQTRSSLEAALARLG